MKNIRAEFKASIEIEGQWYTHQVALEHDMGSNEKFEDAGDKLFQTCRNIVRNQVKSLRGIDNLKRRKQL